MILFVLAYLGGVLTIASPCILPVLPFVFARADRSFVSTGLPMLVGMVATFAAVATLAAVGGGWVVAANEYGRVAALALMALFGIALLFPALSDHLTRPIDYAAGMPQLNEWSLSGDWTIGGEHADLNAKDGAIVYRFHARDVHLVLGTTPGHEQIRFRVSIDGEPPADNHGADVDADGQGIVNGKRLYQLVRQHGTITDRTVEIRFLDPGVQAYALTFG